MKFLVILLALFLVSCGCDKYASDYSCSYVIDDANYDVFYYKDLIDTWQKLDCAMILYK